MLKFLVSIWLLQRGLHQVPGNKFEHFFFLNVLYFCLFFFLAIPCGMRDLSSLTRDPTHAPLHEDHGVLTPGPLGKSQG